MTFRMLYNQMVVHLKRRISNGEMTERSLARKAGVSQPHLHNVLKGVRTFSPSLADEILSVLRIDLADLVAECRPPGLPYTLVPMLQGLIGPGNPYPHAESPNESYPFLDSDLRRVQEPVAVRLAPDPLSAHLFSFGAVALLERSEIRRIHPGEDSYYAMDLPGGSAIRKLRLIDAPESAPVLGDLVVELDRRRFLRVVQGRVCMIVRRW